MPAGIFSLAADRAAFAPIKISNPRHLEPVAKWARVALCLAAGFGSAWRE
jgi:hypothetical protein